MWSDFDSGAAAGFYSQNRLGFSSFCPTFCLRTRVRIVLVTDFVLFSRKAYNVISVSAIPFRIRASPQLVYTPDDPRLTTTVLVKPHGTRLGLCLCGGVSRTPHQCGWHVDLPHDAFWHYFTQSPSQSLLSLTSASTFNVRTRVPTDLSAVVKLHVPFGARGG